jgi:3,4-dihydroxy 2-butanone 4-phosphate synthase/GTP cyclohydrolase II
MGRIIISRSRQVDYFQHFAERAMIPNFARHRKPKAPLASVEEALEEIRRGKMIILMDDEDRENEGDLCMAAEKVTPEAINFMAAHGRGLICLPMSGDRIDRLGLTMMVGDNQAPLGTAFTVSITASVVADSGVSARGRATTILQATREDACAGDFVTPGHVFPLRARDGGVLVRTGQTEGAVDLARFAGFKPAGVICEILNDDGTMARRKDLVEFALKHELKIITVADLVEYRLRSEILVQRIAEAWLPTAYGDFRAYAYRSLTDLTEHLVLAMGEIDAARPVLVRVHREYMPGDVFGYLERDTQRLVSASMARIAQAGAGVILYLRRTVNAIGAELDDRPSAQRTGLSTHVAPSNADFRDFGIGAQILRDIGVRKMILLSNSAPRLVSLPGYGLEIVSTMPLTEPAA